jgi:phenylpropionate dioxygenase-like ring-hydroxylating dioxygenase large terminal subunit
MAVQNVMTDGKARVLQFLKESVRPGEGTLHPFIFSDRDIYELESERLFMKCWVYVAHETEIPAAGDYVVRNMGEQSVIVSRGEDGTLRVFLNACRHRGMKVCRSDLGNASHFRCPYHGFTYKNSGELTGVPFQRDAYGPELDKSQLSLYQARTETYKGLIYATWNESAEPLDAYLSHMKWYIDLLVGRAEMEVIGSPQVYEVAANWKLAAENFITDAYHTAHTHGSIVELGLVPNPTFAKHGYHIHAGNGHGLGLGTGVPGSPDILPQELMEDYARNLTPEQFAVLKRTRNLHATVFPNLSFLISALNVDGKPLSIVTLRQWIPKGPEKLEIWSWFLVEKNASEEWKERSRRAYILTFGSSGMFEQDDTENWSDITETARGLSLHRKASYDLKMGLNRQTTDAFEGPGAEIYDGKYSEANSRAFYGRWLEYMTKEN